MAKTETLLNELKINVLTQEQYNAALANGEINTDELYMTPPKMETWTFTLEDGTTVTKAVYVG